MVRREEDERLKGRTSSRCAFPTGASPVPVSAGAPGSRPHPSGRDLGGRAGRQEPVERREPCSGEQARGRQHQVKSAASTDLRSGSRADHVTAKATPTVRAPERVVGPGGVWDAARVQGEARNSGDPSAPPWSRQGGSYKSKTKSSTAQRESEGTTVPMRIATKNAVGGKGPCGGRVDRAGKREGMAAKSGPNPPGGKMPRDKVRQLQRRLWAAAKRSTGRRFHALYDHIARRDVLDEAWRRVRANRGAAGVDKQTLDEVEQHGVDRFL